jgi:hypothetical protein
MKKIVAITLTGLIAMAGLSGCSTQANAREQAQKSSQSNGTSLEVLNLKRKKDREEKADMLRYVYIMNFGTVVGYYVAKGKISSSGSQVGPETEVLRELSGNPVVDSAQDDGSYGAGDPGIFFFTADDIMVETSLDYVVADQPISIDVPRLSK